MEYRISQKKQMTMFCSLTVAYMSMLVGISRYVLKFLDQLMVVTMAFVWMLSRGFLHIHV